MLVCYILIYHHLHRSGKINTKSTLFPIKKNCVDFIIIARIQSILNERINWNYESLLLSTSHFFLLKCQKINAIINTKAQKIGTLNDSINPLITN